MPFIQNVRFHGLYMHRVVPSPPQSVLQHSPFCKKKTIPTSSGSPFLLSPQPLATSNPISVPIDLTILDLSCKGNHCTM